jgi:hypothetical protein
MHAVFLRQAEMASEIIDFAFGFVSSAAVLTAQILRLGERKTPKYGRWCVHV